MSVFTHEGWRRRILDESVLMRVHRESRYQPPALRICDVETEPSVDGQQGTVNGSQEAREVGTSRRRGQIVPRPRTASGGAIPDVASKLLPQVFKFRARKQDVRAVGVIALTEGTAGVVSKVESKEVRVHREVSGEELSRQGSFLPRQRLSPL